MKKTLLTLTACMLASCALALDWQAALEYITRDAPGSTWELAGKANQVWISKWESTIDKPTAQEVAAIEPTAVAWKKDKTDTENADYEKWTERERALCRLFVKEINKLRKELGLSEYTKEQVEVALKAEM